jgi:cytochrome c
MKRFAMAALTAALGLAFTEAAWAQGATKEECVAKAQDASQMVKEKGLEAAVAELNKKEGKYVWKDSYVFLMDLDGKMLAHPMSPALIGKNLLETKDKGEPGKLLFKEFVEVA